MPTNPDDPAFPHGDAHRGMTLRDYFASQALTGILAFPTRPGDPNVHGQVARAAYEYADAMLAARRIR